MSIHLQHVWGDDPMQIRIGVLFAETGDYFGEEGTAVAH